MIIMAQVSKGARPVFPINTQRLPEHFREKLEKVSSGKGAYLAISSQEYDSLLGSIYFGNFPYEIHGIVELIYE